MKEGQDIELNVEISISSPSKIISTCKNFGELETAYSTLTFRRYVFLDEKDDTFKARNPHDVNLPIVKDALVTVVGKSKDVIQFVKDATTTV